MIDRLRDRVRDAIGEMITAGEFDAGTHLDEISVAEQIGVSRTPVREALIALESEGLVISKPRKGFVAISANPELVRESFPILAALEAMALTLSGASLQSVIEQMCALNDELAEETNKKRQYELDRSFHKLLTDGCGNTRLLALLDFERARLRLIDGHHGKGMADLDQSVTHHAEIIAAIKDGRISDATDILTHHWKDGVEIVVEWFERKASEA